MVIQKETDIIGKRERERKRQTEREGEIIKRKKGKKGKKEKERKSEIFYRQTDPIENNTKTDGPIGTKD